jgi:Domain of unknown function (DUF4389)
VSYPVTFEADYSEHRNRLTALVRLILAIPLFIWGYIYSIVAWLIIVVAWFAIVVTGRYPEGMYDFVANFTRFYTRVLGYTALMCDAYPSFGGGDDPDYPVRVSFEGPLEHYSRVKTLFRVILAIPIVIVRYVIGLLLEVGAIAAWFVILVTGKLPRGLFDLMVLANSFTTRSDAYLFLLTETYPPFQDEDTRAAGVPGPPPPDASGVPSAS